MVSAILEPTLEGTVASSCWGTYLAPSRESPQQFGPSGAYPLLIAVLSESSHSPGGDGPSHQRCRQQFGCRNMDACGNWGQVNGRRAN